jgi:hypothetical protein
MLSFLNSVKNDIKDCYYVFSNFSFQDLQIVLILYQQAYNLIKFFIHFSIVYVNYLNIVLIYNYCMQNKYMVNENQSISKDIS